MRTHTGTIIILATIALVASAALCAWTLLEIQSNAQEIAKINSEYMTASEQANHARVLEKLLDAQQAELEEFDTLFTVGNDIVDLLQEIENFGSYAGVSTEVDTVRSVDDGIYISLSFPGSFSEVMHMLTLLENIPKAAFIDSVQLTHNDKTGLWSGRVGMLAL